MSTDTYMYLSNKSRRDADIVEELVAVIFHSHRFYMKWG